MISSGRIATAARMLVVYFMVDDPLALRNKIDDTVATIKKSLDQQAVAVTITDVRTGII